jgi:hypothetical protein
MQASDGVKRIFRRTAFVVIAVAVAFVSFGWLERERNEQEEYRVYSAYLSEGLLNDAHDWSIGGPVQVVIADRTISGGNLRFRLFSLFDRRVDFGELQTSTRASYLARNLFRTRIESKFSLPTRATAFVTPEGEYSSPAFQEKFPRNMGFVVLSGVGFNPSKTQAVFYINHFCGLCGGGRYVLMEKIGGAWRVRDEHYTWIS